MALQQQNTGSLFEGCEKKLEIDFRGRDLRYISRGRIEKMLRFANCTIISASRNRFFDSYILSESSLFVYPSRLILKTCGTTSLLSCLPSLLKMTALNRSFVELLQFSRSNFLFPDAQPFPHKCFDTEIEFLNEFFDGEGFIIGPVKGPCLNVYLAENKSPLSCVKQQTLELVMTNLDPKKLECFYQRAGRQLGYPEGRYDGDAATRESGIDTIFPSAIINATLFSPCGYSCNALFGPYYFTIHITPEPECSFVSFETNFIPNNYGELISKALSLFSPGSFSTFVFCEKNSAAVLSSFSSFDGYTCANSIRAETRSRYQVMFVNHVRDETRLKQTKQTRRLSNAETQCYSALGSRNGDFDECGDSEEVERIDDDDENGEQSFENSKEFGESEVCGRDGEFEVGEETNMGEFREDREARELGRSATMKEQRSRGENNQGHRLEAEEDTGLHKTWFRSGSWNSESVEFGQMLRDTLCYLKENFSVKKINKNALRNRKNNFGYLIRGLISEMDADQGFTVLDVSALVRVVFEWIKSSPNVRPYYYVNFYSNQLVVSVLSFFGCGFCCYYPEQVDYLIDLGVDKNSITISNRWLLAEEIDALLRKGVFTFKIRNCQELENIASAASFSRFKNEVSLDLILKFCDSSKSYSQHLQELEKIISLAKSLQARINKFSFASIPKRPEQSILHLTGVLRKLGLFSKQRSKEGGERTIELSLGLETSSNEYNSSSSVIGYFSDRFKTRFSADLDLKVDLAAELTQFVVKPILTNVVNIVSVRKEEVKMAANRRKKRIKMNYFVDESTDLNFLLEASKNAKPEVVPKERIKPKRRRKRKKCYRKKPENLFDAVIWGQKSDYADCLIDSIRLPRLDSSDWLFFRESNVKLTDMQKRDLKRTIYIAVDGEE